MSGPFEGDFQPARPVWQNRRPSSFEDSVSPSPVTYRAAVTTLNAKPDPPRVGC